MLEYFLAYNSETKQYEVKCEWDDGSVTVHSAFHHMGIARNTVLQLNARLVESTG